MKINSCDIAHMPSIALDGFLQYPGSLRFVFIAGTTRDAYIR